MKKLTTIFFALLTLIYLALGYIPTITTIIIFFTTAFRYALWGNESWLITETFPRFFILLIASFLLTGIVLTTQQSVLKHFTKKK